jgi:hypothetical protein
MDENGRDLEVEPPPPATYRGRLAETDEVAVLGAVIDGGLHAQLYATAGDMGSWTVYPLAAIVPAAPRELHLVYRTDDIAMSGKCGLDALPAPGGEPGTRAQPEEGGGGGRSVLKTVRIAMDTNASFYSLFGNNAAAVTARAELTLDRANWIFETRVGITHQLGDLFLGTSATGYTSTDDDALLQAFRSYWNTYRTHVIRGAAYLLVGQGLSNGVLGIAQSVNGEVGHPAFAYALTAGTSNDVQRGNVTAHELAHLWSAQHCNRPWYGAYCYLMCSLYGLDSPDINPICPCCDGFGGEPPQFGGLADWQITSYANSCGCVQRQPYDFNGDGHPDIMSRHRTTGAHSLWQMSSFTYLGAVTNYPVLYDIHWWIAAIGDLNSDGQSDVLMRNWVTGDNKVWIMNGSAIASTVVVDSLSAQWYAAGIADFTGDSFNDVLWRNGVTGANMVWPLDGSPALGSFLKSTPATVPTEPNTEWQWMGVGDFDGDRDPDILSVNAATGQMVVWHMNGTAYSHATFPPALDHVNWYVGMVADFEKDGDPDIVLRHKSTGENGVWVMNGSTREYAVALQQEPSLLWQMPGYYQSIRRTLSDFNADGHPDILSRHLTSGAHSLWLMSNFTYTGAVTNYPDLGDTDWWIAAVGDLNADGQNDVLMRNRVTGDNKVWIKDGPTVTQIIVVDPLSAQWYAAGIADFTGNGINDILWRNRVTGANMVWPLDGSPAQGSFLSGSAITIQSEPATVWQWMGVGDFDRDGDPDIFAVNSATGMTVIWHMNGTAYSHASFPPVLDHANWYVGMIADFEKDGDPDIVLRHRYTGENGVWVMEGSTRQYAVALQQEPSLQWQMPGYFR